MGRILGRRTLRELRAHGLRYLALGLMIGLSIYLIVSLLGVADTVIYGSRDHWEKNRLEDGQFTTFVPLTRAETDRLSRAGVELEAMFCREYQLPDTSVLRVFPLRQRIDLAELETGDFPRGEDEILLEKRYCMTKGLSTGDRIELAGRTLTVSGIATSPDYDGLFRNMGDSTADSANFSTAFVTRGLYDLLAESGESLQAEEYLYAYRLEGEMTDGALKEELKTFTFDPETVEDPCFREYWDRKTEKRRELQDAVADLAQGSQDLSDGLRELEETLSGDELSALHFVLPDDFYEAVADLRQGGEDLAEGNGELRDAVEELLDQYWTVEADNLRSFTPASDNPRIGAAADDVVINKYASILAGVIILALMAYVISVFVVHGIEEERSVIGTLYALGFRRRELLRHYLVLPVLVSLAAGALGTLVGYSRVGVPLQTADTYAYFSVPALATLVEPWVIVYGVVMPPVTAALVNWIVIRKKLAAPALQMIRGEEKRREAARLDLRNLGFIRRFQLRQLIREGRSALGVVLGIFVCLLLMMIGINAYVLCNHVGQNNVADTKYGYMYLYKYPEETPPENGYPAYAETLKKEALGYNMDVTVLGLEQDNPFFGASPEKSQSLVQISSAMAQKFALDVGDDFLVNDTRNDRLYAFTVGGVVAYSPAFFVFMDIGSMRELFGAEEDYYNVVFSREALDIDPGLLYSVSTRADVEKAADIFVVLMYSMVITMVVASGAIMAIVMYLMMKVMVDRSARGIALFKVFGYRKRELSRLFLSGNTLLIVVGSALSIPLAKIMMDAIYPKLVANVACALDLHFDPWIYGALFGGVLLLYLLIYALLVRRVHRIPMAEVLKNRE